MDVLSEIIGHIELHSVEGIRKCFLNGLSPNHIFRGQPLINELISEYLRGPRFKKCVEVFVQFGLELEDKALLAVLLDDDKNLEVILTNNPDNLVKSYSLRSAYTPLIGVTLLHICAEYNHLRCAKVLIDRGAGVNAKAGVDSNGFGGQTPIFHTVNQNLNASKEMLDFLLARGADLKETVKGLIWGEGYEWETLIPSVNPISYAMMGLLPQMHRNENDIAEVVAKLLKQAYDIDYKPENIPNKYLNK